jgi:anaerobic ribonucleoside-triphosphate reductase
MIYIIKRNGNQVEFDKEKIINAINKAFIEVDGQLYEDDTAKDIADEIYSYAERQTTNLTVETIQDLIEDYLMRSERRDVARSYIRYRYKR